MLVATLLYQLVSTSAMVGFVTSAALLGCLLLWTAGKRSSESATYSNVSISQLLNCANDASVILHHLCQAAIDEIRSTQAVLLSVSPAEQLLLPEEDSGALPVEMAVIEESTDELDACTATRISMQYSSDALDISLRSLFLEDITRVAILPIDMGDGRAYYLLMGNDSRQEIAPSKMSSLSNLAAIASSRLSKLYVGRHANDHMVKFKIASQIMAEMGPQCRLIDVTHDIVASASDVLESPAVALFTIDPCMGDIECQGTPDVNHTLQSSFLELAGEMIFDRERRNAYVINLEAENHRDQREAQDLMAEGIKSILACPVRSAAGASGALVAFYPYTQPSRLQVALIESISVQTSAIISYTMSIEQNSHLLDDLAGANQELSVQATSDGLTGLANHRTMQQKLNELCKARSSKNQRVFSLVMVDVDHFKIYNDTHGHQNGDIVLRQVARVLSSKLRQGDFAARYGGEEFALILRGIGKDEAFNVADRIRRAVSEHNYEKGYVTVSMGVAEYPADGDSSSEVIEKADRALYHSKITGRNRVVVWGSSGCSMVENNAEVNPGDAKQKSILVVESDNEEDAGMIANTLSNNSCMVEVTNEVTQAAEMLRTRVFDVALVSCDALPNQDVKGLSTLAAIHPHMPVILVTRKLEVEESREALRRGASDVLVKPFKSEELPIIIERNLERRRLERMRVTQKSTGLMLQAIDALVAAIDAKDHYTAGHSQQVTTLSLGIASELNIAQEERSALELAARLHDVGKLGLPDSALNKESPLTEEEWQAMREHPALGSKIVGAIDELAYVSTIIRHHHERLEGTGYPDGLRGPAIPYPARIIAVADAYEAMTSERAYRSRLSPQDAIAELNRHVGSYYDADIVNALEKQLISSRDIPEQTDKAA